VSEKFFLLQSLLGFTPQRLGGARASEASEARRFFRPFLT